MAIIKTVLQEELSRLLDMEKSYESKIEQLPKGSIRMKLLGRKEYPYLNYREGHKVRSKYISPNVSSIVEVQAKIEQRKKFEKDLREVKKDIRLIRKVIKDE